MTLAAGARLGPYEIVAPLGAGGMGELYRARDTRLGREVAIKVLREIHELGTQGRMRFEQEARAASALNHPNIISVFDIGETGTTPYIAMELVVGRTLRELLDRGPMPTKRLLAIASQVADGLAKAHGAGIVHRDVKPENVMVTEDGFAKILDFGVVRLVSPPASQGGEPATTAAGITGPGVVLGTFPYMSPEQALGRGGDFRSDQFSFGSMLYEMLTGKKPFARRSGAETLAAVIGEEPEPLDRVAPTTPVPLRWIVERCLAKDPEDRYASTKDLARDLARLRDGQSESRVPHPSVGVAPVPARSRRWGVAAALLLVAALAAGTSWWVHPRPQPPRWRPLTFRRGAIGGARFAPDGETVIYAAAWEGKPMELYSTRLDSEESTRLPLPPADLVAISQRGTLAISLVGPTPILAEVPLAGGAPRELVADFVSADWVPGEEKLAVVRGNHLEFPIGKVLYEPPPGNQIAQAPVRVSPDGTAFALFENYTDVVILDRSGRVMTRSSGWDTACFGTWNPRTGEFWFSAREAGRTDVFLEIHATTRSGRHRVVARGPSLLLPMDVLPDGRTLCESGQWPVSMMCLPPGGDHEVNLSWLDFSVARDLSPDGRWILFDDAGLGGGSKGIVYMRGTDGSNAKRLGDGYACALSPDGRWAVSMPSLRGDRMVVLPTGAGERKELRFPGSVCDGARWFPDSKRILVSLIQGDRPPRLFVVDSDGGLPRPVTPEGFEIGPVSPDGKYAAVRKVGAGPVLLPIAGGGVRSLPGTTPEDWAVQWESPTRLFIASGSLPVRIDRYDIGTGQRHRWKELGPTDRTGVDSLLNDPFWTVVATPDGTSYAYSFARDLRQLFLVTGLE